MSLPPDVKYLIFGKRTLLFLYFTPCYFPSLPLKYAASKFTSDSYYLSDCDVFEATFTKAKEMSGIKKRKKKTRCDMSSPPVFCFQLLADLH